jgi:DNA replication protein DnaC
MRRLGDILGDWQPPERSGASKATPRIARPDEDVCPICKGRGYILLDVEYGHPDFGKLIPCRCTEARIALNRSRELHGLSNLGGLDRMTFDTFLPDGVSLPESVRAALHRAFDLALEYAKRPRGWLVLLGGYGAGKTHLAAAIANYNIELGRPAIFVVVPDLLDHLRAAFGPTSESGVDERLDTIRETPLLILDDLGAHHSTPWAQEKLFQILNHRYNGRLPTVITTNQRLEELDPRVASRLADLDLSQIFEIPAPDYRQGGGGHGVTDRGARNLSSLPLHADQTFDNFSLRRYDSEMTAARKENLGRAVQEARSFAENPAGWLVFSGTYGCGKTHLAAAIANYQLAKGRATPMFVVVPDLLDHLRATFSPAAGTTLDRVFEQVKSASLLVLDDLGTESATPWAREKLFQLLNHRYAARLPTVITTTARINEIEPKLQSRMLDTTRCTFFVIEAPSFRGSEAQRDKGGSKGPKGATAKRDS